MSTKLRYSSPTDEQLASHLLIVDDEEANLQLLERLFRSLGYAHLRLVSDPRLVEGAFEEFAPDLVALDLHMPHISGFDLLERLTSRIPADDFLPMVVLTADVSSETRYRALAKGATDFLTKPVDLVEVSLRVHRLLETRGLHRSLAQQRSTLTGAVEERTAELVAANHRLQGLVRAKDEFLATISHELRTPLTVVVGYSRELADRSEQFDLGGVQSMAHLIADHSSEMAALIDDLLVATRAGIGSLAVRTEPVRLAAELEAAVSLLPRDQAAAVRRPSTDCTLLADRLRLRQVLRNLLANAFRHGARSAVVEVQALQGSVSLLVKDDGPGVPDSQRQRIFEPFFGSSLQGQPASIGLGLTVSRQLARLMGGDLVCLPSESGAVFRLSLPTVPS
jgi:signal transduction histidine kinase